MKTRTAPFFLLAFAITWTLQIPAALAQRGILLGPVERWLPFAVLGTLGPTLAALAVSYAESRGACVRALFQRHPAAHPLWYPAALFASPVIFLLGTLIHALVTSHHAGPWLYLPADAPSLIAVFVLPIGEEIGWRAFALPRLTRSRGPLAASLLLGLLWALWHLPMFDLARVPLSALPWMVPFFVAGSVVFGWIYQRSRGGLSLMILAHAGAHLSNSHKPLPANATPLIVHTLSFCVAAAVLVAFDRKAWQKDAQR